MAYLGCKKFPEAFRYSYFKLFFYDLVLPLNANNELVLWATITGMSARL